MDTIFNIKHAHFIGIGGISMSSIAHVLLERGIEVSGSDQNASPITQALIDAGAKVNIGHCADNITSPDIIIYTGAISNDNPEFLVAQSKNIPLIPRTVALNDVLALHEHIIAISGTHGKTTVTSMLTHILRHAIGDVSYMIGAHLNETGKAYHIANSDYVTVEACEYQANFLNLYPTSLIINNIEPEHMDYYKSIEQLVDTFRTFAKHLPNDGYLFVNMDDENASKLYNFKQSKVITFGTASGVDYQAVNIAPDSLGRYNFDVLIRGQHAAHVNLNIFGQFNVLNALAAIATAHCYGIDINDIASSLESFVNSDRRFEHIGHLNGTEVISDYAHHPSEVKATLSDIARIKDKKVVVVFQPHTYSRTKAMLNDFAHAFDGIDALYITDIYAARETNTYNIHASDLVTAINEKSHNATLLGDLGNFNEIIQPKLTKDTLLLMMGAGSIDRFARDLVK